jgi:hypothetical protein
MLVEIKGTLHPGNPSAVGPFEGRTYDVPPGYVLVEYVGDESPFDDPYVTLRIQMGKYTPDQVEVLREMARRAIKPWAHLRRTITKGGGFGEIPGFSRSYVFGHGQRHKPPAEPGEPGSFYQLMTNRDADLLKSSEAGYQFRIHPHDPPRIITPPTDIRIVQRDDMRNYGSGWTRRMR